MALLFQSPEIISLTGREILARTIPRIRSRNVRFCVCSGVKDLEKKGLKLKCDDNYDGARWLYGQVKESETVPFPSRKVKGMEEKKRDYYVNTGYAIRTLREEFPELFYRELSFDIYRDDIVFKDPLNAFAGIESYKSIFWALRFHGRIFFRALWVDIISVWQPVENKIMVRWAVMAFLEYHGRAVVDLMAPQNTSLIRMGRFTSTKFTTSLWMAPTNFKYLLWSSGFFQSVAPPPLSQLISSFPPHP